MIKEKTPAELKTMLDHKEDFQLIDVREPSEYEISNLDGELIPMGQIVHQPDKIRKDVPVIIYCRSGSRSGAVCAHLEKTFGLSNLYNLKGGIIAYAREFDPSLMP